ncbi:MAG: hypothetical protein CVU05_14510 [Bacteroidetes bacterium HGW-Bacteroidetes-21]|nr:MAG: hypothetical protein CVU05_14510 [Bacteroidetes bacterium HGW-Bacteroidetes-21]
MSCKKDKEAEETTPINNSPIILADSILFIDFIPDIVVNSIRYFGTDFIGQPYGCDSVPIPVDTLVKDSIIIENQFNHEFYFSASNYYQLLSHHDFCLNYNYGMSIRAINVYDSIAVTSPYLETSFSSGDTINHNYIFTIGAPLINHSFPPSQYYNFTGEKYIGFKRHIGNQIFYGWILIERISENGILIKECAINKTSGNSIICGQTN